MPKEKEPNLEENIEEAVEMPQEIETKIETEIEAEVKTDSIETATVETTSDELTEEQTSTIEVDYTPDQETPGDETVTVKPVRFASFEEISHAQGETNKNLDILMDIKLQLTVELGRTELPIKKVLELTRGSIIELEKVAGEPVELYANGKLIAHGEVVVIEDNFGLRITSITEPDERLKV